MEKQKSIVEVTPQMPKGMRAFLQWVKDDGVRLPKRWRSFPGAEVRRINVSEGLVSFDVKTERHYTLTEEGTKALDDDVARDKSKELPKS